MNWGIFFLIFLMSVSGQAKQTVDQLPAIVENHMRMKVENGQCEKEWALQFDDLKILKTGDPRQRVIATPCARWSHNLTYSFFLVVTGSESNPYLLVQPLTFVRYSTEKGLHSSDVLTNIRWDDENKIVTSSYFRNGHTSCGEVATYNWNVGQQTFQIKDIKKKDNCENLEEPWKVLANQWLDIAS